MASRSIMLARSVLLLSIFLTISAFQQGIFHKNGITTTFPSVFTNRKVSIALFMSESQDDTSKESNDGDATSKTTSTTPETVKASTAAIEPPQEKENPYPIDLPSPILLSSSMLLAIATTG